MVDENRAMHQDIRSLQICILNLMPLKEDTELQLLRSLSNTPLQIDVSFMQMSSHHSSNTSPNHLNRFYNSAKLLDINIPIKKAELKINEAHTIIKLKLSVDTRYGSVMDYFEIFMQRMILCRKAAEKLGLQFKLMINEQQLI